MGTIAKGLCLVRVIKHIWCLRLCGHLGQVIRVVIKKGLCIR